MITKLENVGCARPIVGLVIPAGYSFTWMAPRSI